MDEQMRASDRERDATVDVLSTAVGEGRLTLEEFSARVEVAHAATHRAELARLTADLPTPDHPNLSHAAVKHPGSQPELAAIDELSVFGDLKRMGAWMVPASGRWRSCFGDVVLDLREARVTGTDIHIHASTVFGDIDLLVPPGILVQVRSKTFFGDIVQKGGVETGAGSLRVVLTGGTFFGDVKVRPQRTREKLMDKWRSRRSS